MNAKQFSAVAPPVNTITNHRGALWRVSYHNPGKLRVTTEAIAIVMPGKDGSDPTIRLLSTGEDFSAEQFEAYRRRKWPLPHELGRNPNNQTLGVKSGVGISKGGL